MVPRNGKLAAFSLDSFLMSTHGPKATVFLGGSATPAMSIKDIIALSSDQPRTTAALTTDLATLQMSLGSGRGLPNLRKNIASTYHSSAGITADNIIVTNATTGANHIIERSLLESGDHVIVQYPIYGPSIEEPLAIGCSVSYIRLNPAKGWSLDPDHLNALIIPGKTKMILLNSPNNPTGSHLDSDTQRSIIRIAKQHNVFIHCDEIFRPLFHESAGIEMAPSFIEHPDLEYDRIAVTSSLSKCYGLSGVRIGWITTRSLESYNQFLNYRLFSVGATSTFDETVATEVLSPRCRPGILSKHLQMAQQNLGAIQAFVDAHPRQMEWTRPTAGAVAFVKFKDYVSGKPVDEFDFAERLIEKNGVLVTPGTLCFEFKEDGLSEDEFKGRVRFHFTAATSTVEEGLKGLAEFLEEEKDAAVAAVNES